VKRINKRGFTLIEMLLAIAVTMIICGLFFTLVIAIRSSYYRSYNDDDCADIAQMYGAALENQVLYDIQNGLDDKIYIDSNGILTNQLGTITFDLIDDFNRTSTEQKWDIRMMCLYDPTTCEFRYRFWFVDKYVDTDYLHYTYEGSFWIPYYATFENANLGSGDTYDPTGTDRNGWDYNVTSPSVTYTIDITPQAVVSSQPWEAGLLTSSSLSGSFHRRAGTNGAGLLQTDSADTDLVSIPAGSSVVTIGTT